MSLLKKLGMSLASFGLAFALNLETRLYAKDIYVPKDYGTIQAAIDDNDTVAGDRVLVAAGVYDVNEPISFRGKGITLKSEESPENTIINSNSPYTTGILRFENNENENSVLDGFTITPVTGIRAGGVYCNNSSPIIKGNIIIGNIEGISCSGGSPQILNNTIIKNTSFSNGGGIRCCGTGAVIRENIIKDNYADGEGGGIFCEGDSSIIIKGNYIIDNLAYGDGGGIHLGSLDATIKNNIIAGNTSNEEGGGISSAYSQLYIFRNTITDNSTSYDGGGIFFYHEEGSPFHGGFMKAANNIIWSNRGSVWGNRGSINDLSDTGPSEISYNCFSQQYCGINNNICKDPLFVNPNPDLETLDDLLEKGNYKEAKRYVRECYSLQPNSPCIDAGSPDSPRDPDGTRADMGAIPYNQLREFIRGDANIDRKVNLADVIYDLDYLFAGGEKPKCKDSADVNDDGRVDLSDSIYLLHHLFNNKPIPPPFPELGRDETEDDLGCREYE